jgi:Mce-associated membrane protein
VVAAAGRADDAVSQNDPSRPASPRFRQILFGLLCLGLVAALVVLVVSLGARMDADNDADAARESQSERSTVMLRTRDWVLAALNYSKSDLGSDNKMTEFGEKVSAMLTTANRAQYEKTLPGLAQLVSKEGFARVTTVQRTGVETIDDDSARVLVAGLISETQKATELPPVPYQLLVELEKVQGKWLIADFNDVGGEFK